MTIITKYDKDDTVFYMANNEIHCSQVSRILKIDFDVKGKINSITYFLQNGVQVTESGLFPSKIELINKLTGAEL